MFFKYPRTYHLPWSESVTNDDKIIRNLSAFHDKNIVVLEKMDGENTTMYRNHIHARSIDSRHHASRNYVKRIWSEVCASIPEGWRVCGENLYAKHSIGYDELESYFLVFSIWDDTNKCLSWNDTVEWCELLGLSHVPVIQTMVFNESYLERLPLTMDFEKQEGYVIRLEEGFDYEVFDKSVAKYVRAGHVQTDKHWMDKKIIANTLR
jgi:ATP-dependent RNA circularization protein (DNA/RNA ligase family)